MIRINLLKTEPKEIREAAPIGAPEVKARGKALPWAALFFPVLAVAVGALFYTQKRAIDEETHLLAQAREEKSKLQYVIVKLEELQSQKLLLERKINLINYLKAKQEVPVRIMDELSRSLPDWVWLMEAQYNSDTGNLRVRGRALSNNLIADYITGLEGSPVLMNVSNITSAQNTGREDQFLEFSLSAAVENRPLPPASPAPPAKKGRAS